MVDYNFDEGKKLKKELERQGYISGVKVGQMIMDHKKNKNCQCSYEEIFKAVRKQVPSESIYAGHATRYYWLESNVANFLKNY